MPDAVGGMDGQPITELVSLHDDLSAMMGFVQEHVGEHDAPCGPDWRPGAAGKAGDLASGIIRQRVREHAKTLGCALHVRGRRLLESAASRIERSRTSQVRSGVFDPDKAAVVKVGEHGGDSATTAWLAGRLGAPGTWVEVGKDELVHRVVDGVGLEKGLAEVRFGHAFTSAREILRGVRGSQKRKPQRSTEFAFQVRS